jgi:hypothetical protein
MSLPYVYLTCFLSNEPSLDLTAGPICSVDGSNDAVWPKELEEVPFAGRVLAKLQLTVREIRKFLTDHTRSKKCVSLASGACLHERCMEHQHETAVALYIE